MLSSSRPNAPFVSYPNIQSRYKLLSNLDRVMDGVNTGSAYPILVNITLTNRCTHGCPLCTSKNLIDDRTMPFARVKELLTELKELGVKAIGLGGGGDPTCHPELESVIRYVGELGMEVALNTNGELLTPGIIDAAVRHCTWVRVSLDADGEAIYRKTHGRTKDTFDRVTENIRALVHTKQKLLSS